ncbi:MAG: hypothetical protein HW384_1251 [Dehalococcoidia bacterium]|nr:hypothetical protein [Dehalococcoidia bacterium]MBF8304178.1 hypothetical protein [Dehalococcoidia bacterium]
MDIFTTALTGFVFGMARDILKEVIRAAIKKKTSKVAEAQVRRILLKHLQLHKQSSQVNFQIENIDVLLKEVYSIANATNELEVEGNTIEIRRVPLGIRISETIREKQIRLKVLDLKAEIMQVVEQDVISETKAPLEEPYKESPERPLMFEEVKPARPIQQGDAEPRDVSEIAGDYKKRIQSVINRGENAQ